MIYRGNQASDVPFHESLKLGTEEPGFPRGRIRVWISYLPVPFVRSARSFMSRPLGSGPGGPIRALVSVPTNYLSVTF